MKAGRRNVTLALQRMTALGYCVVFIRPDESEGMNEERSTYSAHSARYIFDSGLLNSFRRTCFTTYSRPDAPITVEDIFFRPVWSRPGVKDLVRNCCSRIAGHARVGRLFARNLQDLIFLISVCLWKGWWLSQSIFCTDSLIFIGTQCGPD